LLLKLRSRVRSSQAFLATDKRNKNVKRDSSAAHRAATSLLKERKQNSETPLQAFFDYFKVEREVLDMLLQIPQEQFMSEGDRISEATPQAGETCLVLAKNAEH